MRARTATKTMSEISPHDLLDLVGKRVTASVNEKGTYIMGVLKGVEFNGLQYTFEVGNSLTLSVAPTDKITLTVG